MWIVRFLSLHWFRDKWSGRLTLAAMMFATFGLLLCYLIQETTWIPYELINSLGGLAYFSTALPIIPGALILAAIVVSLFESQEGSSAKPR
jgi:hypothetical protein